MFARSGVVALRPSSFSFAANLCVLVVSWLSGCATDGSQDSGDYGPALEVEESERHWHASVQFLFDGAGPSDRLNVELRLPAGWTQAAGPPLRSAKTDQQLSYFVDLPESRARAFRNVGLLHNETWLPLMREGQSFVLPKSVVDQAEARAEATQLRWTFDLERSTSTGARGRFRRHPDRSLEKSQPCYFAPPSEWLLLPKDADESVVLDFEVQSTALVVPGGHDEGGEGGEASEIGCSFASGIWWSEAGSRMERSFSLGKLGVLPYTLFGCFEARQYEIGGAQLEVVLLSGLKRASSEAAFAWAESRLRAVADFYDGFPMPSALVVLEPNVRGAGRAVGYGGGAVHIPLRASTTAQDLQADWILLHELVHLALPNLAARHHWLEEGIATYIEPLIQVRNGWVSSQEAWDNFVSMMPYGLPTPTDRGLDRTRTWGNTYWGGALYCLLADLRIREATDGRLGLEHALRSINQAAGNMGTSWAVERALRVGDRGLNLPSRELGILTELYREMAPQPMSVDLDTIWSRLGIQRQGDRAILLQEGPGARLRKAIDLGAPPTGI